jgi:2-oxoglutarate dehydrogenase E2 component (dihydrolipoamide succinyltransferase)
MKVEVKIPNVGESINEVSIASWVKQDGDYVEVDDVIGEIDSDKATFEINAEEAGVLKIIAAEGETVKVGDKVAEIDTSAKKESGKSENEESEKESAEEDKKEDKQEDSKSESKDKTYADKHPSPAAAKILSEHNISADSVEGTGKDGRITEDDARKAAESKDKKVSKSEEEPAKEKQESSDPSKRKSRKESMTTLRKTIARRLVQVKNETAMLTTFNEVDLSEIMAIRKKYKESFKEKHEVGLGFMSFFTKAVCEALQEFPAVNARIEGEEMVFNEYCDIGIAVSTPRGLVVPNIRNAESMSLAQIEKEILSLAKKARDGKITIEDMQGGTFSITNGGVFGSLLSTPILNAPQSAILGMHNIVERPMAVNGEVVIRPMMYVALSYDHRIVDGKESVSFLVRVKQLLEDPSRMLLGV